MNKTDYINSDLLSTDELIERYYGIIFDYENFLINSKFINFEYQKFDKILYEKIKNYVVCFALYPSVIYNHKVYLVKERKFDTDVDLIVWIKDKQFILYNIYLQDNQIWLRYADINEPLVSESYLI